MGAAVGGEDVGIVVSCAYGSLEAIVEPDRVATLEDARYINPSRFPLTVSNTAAGYASIWEDLRALNVTVCNGNAGGLDAVACADSQLGQKRARALLVGGVEAMSESLELAFRQLGVFRDGGFLGEGSAVFTVEPVEGARERGATVLAEITGYGTRFEPPEREASLVQPVARGRAAARSRPRSTTRGSSRGTWTSSCRACLGPRASSTRPSSWASRRAVGDAPVVAPKRALGEALGAGGGDRRARGRRGATRDGVDGYGVRGALRRPVRTALVTSLGYYGNASALVMRASSG